jgi:hypothetical protein
MATFNYSEKYGDQLDQKITEGLVTTSLGIPEVNWFNGNRSFTLRTIATSGLQNHTRSKGYNEGTVTDSKKTYTMGQDRDIEFFVDKQDVDETNQELSMANISNTFITEHVQPEIDSYRFATMATSAAAVEGHQVTEPISRDSVYTQLKAAILPIRKYNPANITGYVSSETMDALERSSEFTRQITNQNIGLTALESRVTSIDGVQLVEVWDSNRFMSAYDYSDGAVATADATNINYLFAVRPAIIPVVKENSVYLFAPGEHTEGDGYLYQNRLYHDLFVKESMKDGLFASLKPKTDANPK